MCAYRLAGAVLLLAAVSRPGLGETKVFVRAGQARSVGVPIRVEVPVPPRLSALPAEELAASLDGVARLDVQVVDVKNKKAEVCWFIPDLPAGAEQVWTVSVTRRQGGSKGFSWREKAQEYLDFLLEGRPVARYMCAYDTSNKDRLQETYKPYLHVFDAGGADFITKGPGGLYPHHRGLFIGWNKVGFGQDTYDMWHMKDVVQVHRRFSALSAGPVLARLVSEVQWMSPKGVSVIDEERAITAYGALGEQTLALLDFESRLAAKNGDVVLDGDPEHAGFHFRAHDAVEKKATKYLFHKDGIDPHKDRDLPWAAMQFELAGNRYWVQIVNHPGNPRPAIWSAYRDYGRFGVFFKHELKSGTTLSVRNRVWLGKGELPTRQELEARARAFLEPPLVEVRGK